MKIITRFAPSPTGFLHIGGVRTALYSWLFARRYEGKLILRIENTDSTRSNKIYYDSIINTMKWLNIDWDEGPYIQTKRINRYNDIINKLLSSNLAYKCYCTKERIENIRQRQINQGLKPKYDGYCRINNIFYKDPKDYVIRFKTPIKEYTCFSDELRGSISFSNEELDDLILKRSNGLPTYNLCVIVDDLDMEVTHVIRGEEHINNTPRQINILNSLKAPVPKYIHVPIIIGKDGKKLSKRTQTTSLLEYKYNGFLPEALINYISKLGWSCGNKELININELKAIFNIKTISKSPSKFDYEKLLWINQYYIKSTPDKKLTEYVYSFLNKHINKPNIKYGSSLNNIINLYKSRNNTLVLITESCYQFYLDSSKPNESYIFYIESKGYLMLLGSIYIEIALTKDWNITIISALIQKIVLNLNINRSKLSMVLRLVLLGKDGSPGITQVLYAFNKISLLRRIKKESTMIKYIY